MENTTENKARFLNQYAGLGIKMKCIAKSFQLEDKEFRGILLNDQLELTLYLSSKGYGDFFDLNELELPLRSISSLTDEEITTLCKIIGYDISKGYLKSKVISLIDNDLHIGVLTSQSADYLRSIGILIPWMDLSVEQIIEYGWAKEDTSC